MGEQHKSEHERIVELEGFAAEVRTWFDQMREAPLGFGGSPFAGLTHLSAGGFPLIFMAPPPPPPPPKFTRTIMKRRDNHNDYEINGPHKSENLQNGTIVIESQDTNNNQTKIKVKHPPPPGAGDQEHRLNKGSRVTIHPNGDIVIQLT